MKTSYFILAIIVFLTILGLAFVIVTLPGPKGKPANQGPAPLSTPNKPYRPYRVAEGHPRIFLTQASLRGQQGLLSRIGPEGPAQGDFQRIKDWCDANLARSFETKGDYNEALRRFAFLSAALPETPVYGRKAVESAQKLILSADGRNPAFDAERFVVTLALVFDWCWDRMNPDERRLLAEDLVKRGIWLRDVGFALPPKLGEPLAGYLAIGYVGLAVNGEPGLEQESIGMVGAFARGIGEVFIPQRETTNAGGALAGRSTLETRNAESLILALLAWRSATEEDFFNLVLFDKDGKPYRGAKFLRSVPEYFLYATRPDGRSAKLAGDGPLLPSIAPETLFALSTAYRDPLAAQLAEGLGDILGRTRWSRFCRYDPLDMALWRILARLPSTAEVRQITRAPWAAFDSDRLAFYRSSFTFGDADALWLGMVTGSSGSGEPFMPAGHFEFSRGNDSLAVSTGASQADSQPDPFRAGTFAYNLVVPVGEPGGVEALEDPGGRRRETLTARHLELAGDQGAFMVRVNYDLSIDDRLVMSNRRTLVAIQNQLVIVYDCATTAAATPKKRFVLHLSGPVTFAGTTNVIEGTEDNGIAVSTDCPLALCRSGETTLYIKPVLPAQRLVRRVSAGASRRAGEASSMPAPADSEKAAFLDLDPWRLEIEDQANGAETEFLTILAPRQTGSPFGLETKLTAVKDQFLLKMTDGSWSADLVLRRDDGSAALFSNTGNFAFGSAAKQSAPGLKQ